MLSLRFQDSFPAAQAAPQQRWLRGAALSVGVHVIAITAIGVHARQNARWQAGLAAVDLARVASTQPVSTSQTDGVTVGLAEPSAFSTPAELPVLEDGAIEPARPLPHSQAVSRPAPGRLGATSGVRGMRSTSTKLAANEPGTVTPPVGALDLPSAGTDPAAPVVSSAARMAFRSQLRRHLHDAWHANEVFARIDPMGRLDGSLFTTAIKVRLSAAGTLERAELAESSGIAALDKEALASLSRIEPLPPVPAEMLDAQSGWNVLCKFYLDVGLFRFAAEIRRVISGMWHPSRAFSVTATEERKTVVRFVINADGTLVSANVVSPAGLDFLDANALAVAPPGTHLPVPPRAFMHQPGPANVFVAFLHQAGDVRVLKPREDVEDQ
jgi:TonB family protein